MLPKRDPSTGRKYNAENEVTIKPNKHGYNLSYNPQKVNADNLSQNFSTINSPNQNSNYINQPYSPINANGTPEENLTKTINKSLEQPEVAIECDREVEEIIRESTGMIDKSTQTPVSALDYLKNPGVGAIHGSIQANESFKNTDEIHHSLKILPNVPQYLPVQKQPSERSKYRAEMREVSSNSSGSEVMVPSKHKKNRSATFYDQSEEYQDLKTNMYEIEKSIRHPIFQNAQESLVLQSNEHVSPKCENKMNTDMIVQNTQDSIKVIRQDVPIKQKHFLNGNKNHSVMNQNVLDKAESVVPYNSQQGNVINELARNLPGTIDFCCLHRVTSRNEEFQCSNATKKINLKENDHLGKFSHSVVNLSPSMYQIYQGYAETKHTNQEGIQKPGERNSAPESTKIEYVIDNKTNSESVKIHEKILPESSISSQHNITSKFDTQLKFKNVNESLQMENKHLKITENVSSSKIGRYNAEKLPISFRDEIIQCSERNLKYERKSDATAVLRPRVKLGTEKESSMESQKWSSELFNTPKSEDFIARNDKRESQNNESFVSNDAIDSLLEHPSRSSLAYTRNSGLKSDHEQLRQDVSEDEAKLISITNKNTNVSNSDLLRFTRRPGSNVNTEIQKRTKIFSKRNDDGESGVRVMRDAILTDYNKKTIFQDGAEFHRNRWESQIPDNEYDGNDKYVLNPSIALDNEKQLPSDLLYKLAFQGVLQKDYTVGKIEIRESKVFTNKIEEGRQMNLPLQQGNEPGTSNMNDLRTPERSEQDPESVESESLLDGDLSEEYSEMTSFSDVTYEDDPDNLACPEFLKYKIERLGNLNCRPDLPKNMSCNKARAAFLRRRQEKQSSYVNTKVGRDSLTSPGCGYRRCRGGCVSALSEDGTRESLEEYSNMSEQKPKCFMPTLRKRYTD